MPIFNPKTCNVQVRWLPTTAGALYLRDVLTWPCDFSCSAEEHGLFILLSQMFLALFGAKDIVERQQLLLLCVPCCGSALKAFAIM
jgi:hypothetical protein